MAVQEQTPYQEITANGVTTSFVLDFDCESKDHLIVTKDGIEPPIGDWSLTGGAVVFTEAPASGVSVIIQRNTPLQRTTDYQSHNNSFRPSAINKDFDWIWWKLQELGVADWILGNRIDALKAYVDDRDDELRAYLLEEIRKQGVALDQLDEYYNYLMQRLAQIAVDKGWDASFVVDGDENQHQINSSTIRYVPSVSHMLDISNPRNGYTVTTLSYIPGLNKGGSKYTYDSSRAAKNNGVTVINGWVKKNTSRLLASQAGCREGDFENTTLLNNLIEVASDEGIGEVILDGFYKIGLLDNSVPTTTPFGDEPAWWLLKARSNVTVKGRTWDDGLFIAGGLVASNASAANTKGYMVIGDYNQANVENFKIKNFTIDNNGANNLLPVPNVGGFQALCPNVWFQRGTNITVVDINFKDAPGHQTVVLDSGVKGVKVLGNQFIDNGKGLAGNVNIIDHSSIYCRATDFKISGNTLKFTTAKPDISTALEIHGVDGHVYDNTVEGYPFPLIRASFFGQVSKNVLVHDNIFNECNYGVNLDGGANSPLYVDVYHNKFNFRAEKPTDGRPQVAVGHTQDGGFIAVTPSSTHDIIINIHNNKFTQPPTTGNWTIYNEFDNCLWDGGKCTEVNFKNNTFKGFKGGYRINHLNGLAKYSFDDTLINCGSQSTPIKSLIIYQNIDAAWTVPVASVNADSELIYCLYDSQINFLTPVTPVTGTIKGSSTNWILPYEGFSPDASNLFKFEYSVEVVDANKILYAQGIKVAGKISLPNDQYFYKQNGYVGYWNMHRTLTVSPSSPRFFGDIKGDRVDILQPSAGQYTGYICTASSVDVNTVGIWKGFGVVAP